LSQRQIFVLEDDPLIAMMLQDELEAMGLRVVGPANNMKSALQLCEYANLDGALLDLNINGNYATSVADKLRIRQVPFIFVTGQSAPAGLRYKDVFVLHKPFTGIDLRIALIALFENSSTL
jgi:DNA-binding response OmpR family regulator